ncbi:hypothetical protein SOP89_09480 [Pseudomonas siliginis]|uniref:hypothetical protein n=1 Tax=Pseudomonas siliginis TaxID=2842346 RepID=UPI002B254B45|nr:hypothetical protein [Pseudomonas siliginis]MEB2651605.1 hypothetical protein [Pseudomonas siliginis]
MRTDFEDDLLAFVQTELKKMHVEVSSRDVTECALLFLKLQRRSPVPVPRRTERSDVFSVPPNLQSGFDDLCLAILEGRPLFPYLSRSTLCASKSDGLLDDWGILHFHLGSELLANGLVKGTQVVAFGLVHPDCVYFLDTQPHGSGHSDVWVREELIHIVEKNWPSLLPSNGRTLTPDTLTTEQRADCRRKSVNVTVTKQSGEVIFPPGGGVMCDGTAINDFMQLQKIYAQFDWARKMCESKEQWICDTVGIGSKDFRVHIGFASSQLYLYEKNSGVRIEFADLK